MITPNPSDDLLFKTLFILWYIWKARNDNIINRRNWTSHQIHQAAKAHMHTHLEALHDKAAPALILQPRDDVNLAALPTNNSGMPNSIAGTSRGQAHREATASVHFDRFLIPFRTTLQGYRCYIDASTQPDNANPITCRAGLGIFYG
jgi:hypothetical protein